MPQHCLFNVVILFYEIKLLFTLKKYNNNKRFFHQHCLFFTHQTHIIFLKHTRLLMSVFLVKPGSNVGTSIIVVVVAGRGTF